MRRLLSHGNCALVQKRASEKYAVLLLDTDVIVDLSRGYPPAAEWLASLPDAPGLPGYVVMELLSGCRNKSEMSRVQQLARLFQVYWPSTTDCNYAVTIFAQGKLSHNMGLLDALIGACALGLGATLCTFNTRHFAPFPDLVTEQPYSR